MFLGCGCNKGQGSFWQPSAGLLPEQLGCAWLMAPHQPTEAPKAVKQLVDAGEESSKSSMGTRSLRRQLRAVADSHCGKCTEHLQLEWCLKVSEQDMLHLNPTVLSHCRPLHLRRQGIAKLEFCCHTFFSLTNSMHRSCLFVHG